MSEMKQAVCIGIDPGKDGAMAIVSPSHGFRKTGNIADGYLHTIVVPFDIRSYDTWLCNVQGLADTYPDEVSKVVCVLEHVGAMPGQGSVSMFHFGENFGIIQGLLIAHGVPFELVRPQKWKKEFSCTSDKNTSIAVAQRLFPDIDLRRTEKCRGPHDGICEALLMAEYARRVLA